MPRPSHLGAETSRGSDPLSRLVALLSRLPGIGDKSAIRIALALVRGDPRYAEALGQAITDIHDAVQTCRVCCDLTSASVCERCSDDRRDQSVICVVSQPQDRMAIERTGVYRGLYHVLHGVLDPLGGIGPSDLQIQPLLRRLGPAGVSQRDESGSRYETHSGGCPPKEIIIATSPNVEGDATALYLSKLIQPLGIRVSRIASGVAVGGELEYADHTTLYRALEDRRAI